MDLFDLVVAKSLAGSGGGGGGGGDYSTATLTIIDSQSTGAVVNFPSIVDDTEYLTGCYANMGYVVGEVPIVLYKQSCLIIVQAESYTVSGSATDLGGGWVLASGDCTITIT